MRLYDHLFAQADPDDVPDGEDFTAALNPHSLETLTSCQVEPGLAGAVAGSRYQFERQGYFCADPDTTPDRPVFNRTVPLRDTWAKIAKASFPRRRESTTPEKPRIKSGAGSGLPHARE